MTPTLEIDHGGELRRHPLQGAVVVGRSRDCGIRIGSDAVSRRHVRLAFENGAWFVEDLGSRNGTRLNGAPLREKATLSDGDRIGVGDAELRFRAEPARDEVRLVSDLPSDATVVAVRESAGVRCEVEPQAALDAVLAVTRATSSTLDIEALLERVLDVVFDLYPQADRGVLLLTGDDGTLVPKVVRARGRVGDALPLSRSLLARVMERREAVLSEDAGSDPALPSSESLLALPIRSLMCAPLLGGTGEPLGAIQVHTEGRRGSFERGCLDVLIAVANAVGIAVDNARLHRRLLEQDRLQRTLETAREVQKSLLATTPPAVAGYGFFVHEDVADSVGGDYHGFLPLPRGGVAVALGDVSGKGMPAALLAARLSSEVPAVVGSTDDPAVALRQLDRSLAHNGPEGRFVTFLLAVLDPVRHTITLANAGHPPPLHRHAGGVSELRPARIGVPLGLADRDDLAASPGVVALAPGDVVVAYTDGISETLSPAGEEFGVDRLREALAGTAGSDPAAIGSALIATLRAFAGGSPQRDDATLVCFARLLAGGGAPGDAL